MIPISALQSSQAVLSLHSSPCVARTFPAITSIVKSWPHSVVMFPNLFPVLQHHFFFPNLGGYRRGNQLKPAYFAHITMKFVARSGICYFKCYFTYLIVDIFYATTLWCWQEDCIVSQTMQPIALSLEYFLKPQKANSTRPFHPSRTSR